MKRREKKKTEKDKTTNEEEEKNGRASETFTWPCMYIYDLYFKHIYI